MLWPGSQQFWRPLPGCCAPFLSTASGLGSQGFVCGLPRARCAFSLRVERPGSQRFGALSTGAPHLFLPRPQRTPPVGSQEVLDRNRGLFAGWEGVASLGLSLPLAPPPASFLQRGWGCSSLEFLSPFVLRTAGGVFQPVNFSALPRFKKSLPPTALRAFWPVLTLSNAAGSSPLRPLLLAAGAGVRGTPLLGVAFRHVICGPYLISPPG